MDTAIALDFLQDAHEILTNLCHNAEKAGNEELVDKLGDALIQLENAERSLQ